MPSGLELDKRQVLVERRVCNYESLPTIPSDFFFFKKRSLSQSNPDAEFLQHVVLKLSVVL